MFYLFTKKQKINWNYFDKYPIQSNPSLIYLFIYIFFIVWSQRFHSKLNFKSKPIRNLLNCTFEDDSLCDWNGDPRNGLSNWELNWSNSIKSNILCFYPNQDLVYSTGLAPKKIEPISARLWSGHIRYTNSKNYPKCLSLNYFIAPFANSKLSIMRHSSG